MTIPDYGSISQLETDPGKPLRAELVKRMSFNPLAIAGGAEDAPRIQFAAMDEWFSTAGAIGTYVFARSTTASDVAFGATRAGSALVPTGAITGFLSLISGANGPLQMLASGSALSGSWQCMGYYDHTLVQGSDEPPQDVDVFGATLWMRIS